MNKETYKYLLRHYNSKIKLYKTSIEHSLAVWKNKTCLESNEFEYLRKEREQLHWFENCKARHLKSFPNK